MEDLEGMKEYIAFFKHNKKAVGKRKTAILTQSSKQVIHSEILKMMTDHLPMDLKTVSTYDGAFQWIELNDFARVEVRNYLENLRRDNFRMAANL